MKTLLLLAALTAAVPAAADEGCLFDGACAPRAELASSGAEPSAAWVASTPSAPGLSRWDGIKKGASEGALFGFLGTVSPGVALVDEGFGRRVSRAHDGPDAGNGGGGLFTYVGFIVAAVLYVPALALGAVGGLAGGLVGAASPEAVEEWDAERTLFESRP